MSDNINKFILELLNESSNGNYIFRGENMKYNVPCCSSLYRKCEQYISNGFKEVLPQIQLQMLDKAKRYYSNSESDIKVLSDLQHYGAKTNLIDFTKNILIALFFACNDIKASEDKDGIIYFLDYKKIGRLQSFQNINSMQGVYSFEAPINTRALFQSSIFVISSTGFLDEKLYKTIIIPDEIKKDILSFLRKNFNIHTNTIYDDIHGFIANQENSLSTFLFYEGMNFLESKDYEKAIIKLEKVIELDEMAKDECSMRIGYCYLELKDYLKAMASLEQASEQRVDTLSLKAIVNAYLGNYDACNDNITRVRENKNINTYAKYNIACALAILKRKEEALELLEEVLKDNYAIEHIQNDADWDNYKVDSDFQNLISKYTK